MIATAHIEPQTAIILSVLTLKLQLSNNILQNQVVQQQWEMKTVELLLYAVNAIWVVEDLFWPAVAVCFDFFIHSHIP